MGNRGGRQRERYKENERGWGKAETERERLKDILRREQRKTSKTKAWRWIQQKKRGEKEGKENRRW